MKTRFAAETPRRRGSAEENREKQIPMRRSGLVKLGSFMGSSAEGAEKREAERWLRSGVGWFCGGNELCPFGKPA